MKTLDGTTILDITEKTMVFNHIIYAKILDDPNYRFYS